MTRPSLPAPSSQPLTPAEILRTVGSSECASAPDQDDPAPFSEGYRLGALCVAVLVTGLAILALFLAR